MKSQSDESFTSAQGDGGIAGTSSNSQIPTYQLEELLEKAHPQAAVKTSNIR